jgi:hypothetical protein
MKLIHRRLGKLEEKFGPPIETFEMKRLRERIEAGRRRVAELCGERPAPILYPREWGVREVLLAGRQRARCATSEAQ